MFRYFSFCRPEFPDISASGLQGWADFDTPDFYRGISRQGVYPVFLLMMPAGQAVFK